MKSEFKINRAWRYTLLCAILGGFFGFIMAASWFPSGAYLFGISVFLGVGSMARLGHRMNLNEERLYEKKAYAVSALFVGLASHLSSFLLFGIFMYISGNASIYGVTTLGESLNNALLFGILSMILLFWFSIPLYIVTGFITKRLDDQECKEKGIVDYPRVQITEVYNEKLDF